MKLQMAILAMAAYLFLGASNNALAASVGGSSESDFVNYVYNCAMSEGYTDKTVLNYKGVITSTRMKELVDEIYKIDNSTLNDADYLAMNIRTISVSKVELSDNTTQFRASITKSESDAENAYVDTKAPLIISSLGLDGKSTAEKVQIINNWVITNVAYDYSLNSTSAFAALQGKSTCAGYAGLTYKLLLLAGVENKIVVGYTNNNTFHAWNLVNVDGKWFNLDTTANCTAKANRWVLIGSKTLATTHSVRSSYKNYTLSNYSISASDYSFSASSTSAGKLSCAGKISMDKGKSKKLSTSNTTGQALLYKSSNKKVVTISSKGTIKGISAGKATITVSTADGKKVSKCVVTVKGIRVSASTVKLKVGKSYKVSVLANTTGQKMVSSSSNKSVAVFKSGKIVSKKKGTTIIRISSMDSKYLAKIKVTVR